MSRSGSRSLWGSLIVVFAVVCIATVVTIDRRISQSQIRDASDELLLLMTLRRGALESYFDTVRAELTLWSLSDDLRSDLSALRVAWAAIPGDKEQYLKAGYIEENPFPADQRRQLLAVEDGSLYAEAHRAIHPLAQDFVSERGYYDFFLIDPDANIMYSVEKESDFASNLQNSALQNSGLAEVHRRAM